MLVRDIRSASARAKESRILPHGLPGDSAHHVDAELEPSRMDIIGQRFEADAVGGGREFCRSGHEPAELVHFEWSAFLINVAFRMGLIPLNIHRKVSPAERL